jgi:hypothetical protein
MHTPGELVSASPTGDVWRVGRKPAPWGWSDWKWADGGAFPGRWDSPNRTYRTSYAGSSAYASLVEVLAHFRPDPAVVQGIAEIVDDEVDALYPTAPAGVVPSAWFRDRLLARATLSGVFCDVAAARTVACLRPQFLELALSLGLPDFDVAAIQLAEPRTLTQHVGLAIYALTDEAMNPVFDGIRFLSRHGSDLELWTVFEHSDDGDRSRLLHDVTSRAITARDPAVLAAMELHGLSADE